MPIKKINKQLNSIAQHVSESNPSTENVRSLKYFSTTKKLGKIIRIQALFRGVLTRRHLRDPKDNMTLEFVEQILDNYNDKYLFTKKLNKLLSKKKIRNTNFPSEISENIVKFCLFKKYNIMGCWDTNDGDLILLDKKLEIKGFSSAGPSSFGPTEKWDTLYFVDCMDHIHKNFKVYEINLSNKSEQWKNIYVNSGQTFYDQCCQKRRPHIKFRDIEKQLCGKCKLIFDGNISKLY